MIVIITMTIMTRSNSTQPPLPNDVVPSILLSPPVLDQVITIVFVPNLSLIKESPRLWEL